MSVMDIAYDESKFTEMVLYVAARLQNDRAGGATKLNKVLFFAEFTHLRRHGVAISGCEFQKLSHGPAPRQLLPVRRGLIESSAATLLDDDSFGLLQQRLVPARAANLDVFTEEELDSIEEVLTQLAGMTATQVSARSHEEPGWRVTKVGDTIPYSTAFLAFPQTQTRTSARLSEAVATRYGFATTE